VKAELFKDIRINKKLFLSTYNISSALHYGSKAPLSRRRLNLSWSRDVERKDNAQPKM